MSNGGSTDGPQSRSPASRMPLAEVAPDLGAFVPPDDRFVLEQFSVPVVHVSNGSISVGELLERRAAFAAVVFEGLVLHDLAIGGEPALRILGPGDVISLADGPGPSLLRTSRYRARASTRLALLGNDFLAAARRVPTVLVGLRAAEAGQVERLAAQLVICQMPRVADRVQAMLWLLADSFGRVTPTGTRLPVALTHEVLGALVGARRPTVTLALGELAERGAVVHQDGGWLLLEPFEVAASGGHRGPEEPKLLEQEPSEWAAGDEPIPDVPEEATSRETGGPLQRQQAENFQELRETLFRLDRLRERSSDVLRRTRLARRSVSLRRSPSS